MGELIYSTIMSLDGYIADEDGNLPYRMSLAGTLSCQELPSRRRVDAEALGVAFVNFLPLIP